MISMANYYICIWHKVMATLGFFEGNKADETRLYTLGIRGRTQD